MERAKGLILSTEEMISALDLDIDYTDVNGLMRLSKSASQFLLDRTGYDWSADTDKDPVAIDCAILWCRMRFYSNTEYAKDYDYSIGINADLVDLIIKAQEEKNNNEDNDNKDDVSTLRTISLNGIDKLNETYTFTKSELKIADLTNDTLSLEIKSIDVNGAIFSQGSGTFYLKTPDLNIYAYHDITTSNITELYLALVIDGENVNVKVQNNAINIE